MAEKTVSKTEEKSANPASPELLLALGEGMKPVSELLALVGPSAIAVAWVRGEIEFGRTKYCVSGNVEIPESRPTVIIEDGIEWSGEKQRWHAKASAIMAETLPVARFYQKYQREVCVNRITDVWEWLPSLADAKGRETRWARRNIDRDEAESLFCLYVQLTDKGMALLTA